MNRDEVTEFTEKFERLSPKPKSVLKLLLENKTDDEIGEIIGASTATVRKHIQNLCDRFEIEGEVGGHKKNRRDTLIALVARHKPELIRGDRAAIALDAPKITETAESKLASVQPLTDSNVLLEDWGEAPDVSFGFYNRNKELDLLKQWILKDSCRLVVLLGIGGIGKTTLAASLAEQIKDDFERVIWRSLQPASPARDLLADLIKFLSNQPNIRLPDDTNSKISLLIDRLQAHRCLLILDNLEKIMRGGELVGHYQEGYEWYGELLRRVGLERHQSCLVILSRENPREIAALAGETLPVHSLQIESLGEAAQEILKVKGLVKEEKAWSTLIKLYGGNPLALNIVSTMIRELFNGRVSEFLRQGTLVFSNISDLLAQPFNRLSDNEKEILYWLALSDKPISLSTLAQNIVLPISSQELLEALVSLSRRSLIETITEEERAIFTLQRVVREYVINKFIEQISKEINELLRTQKIETTKLLRSHAIVKARVQDEEIQEDTEQLLLTRILDKVRTLVRSDRTIQSQLFTLKENLHLDASHLWQTEKPSLELGYLGTNILNLHKQFTKVGIAAANSF
jgi:hypothetical protein